MARQPPPPLAQYDRWQQQPLTYALASHFPDVFFKTLRFTYIEDSVNSPELSRYAAWVEGRGIPSGCPSPPSYASKTRTRAVGKAEGVQRSAFPHEAARPSLFSLSLTPDQHYDMSMEITEGILPAEKPVMVNEYLKFASAMMVCSKSGLGQLRNKALKAVTLPRHSQKVTTRWRKVQQKRIRLFTIARDMGLLSLLSIAAQWPDYTWLKHLISVCQENLTALSEKRTVEVKEHSAQQPMTYGEMFMQPR